MDIALRHAPPPGVQPQSDLVAEAAMSFSIALFRLLDRILSSITKDATMILAETSRWGQ
jgi:hypothetical protein